MYLTEYQPIEADFFIPLGSNVLVDWEMRKDTLLGGKLISPELMKKWKYTGIVINVGNRVTEEIQIGDRVLFEQFKEFKKYTDIGIRNRGRIAVVEEHNCVAVIPKRLNIESGEEDFDYAA